MSTQPFSSLSENPKLFTAEAAEKRGEHPRSPLDGPWKVAILPEPEMLPPGVIPGPQPHESVSLPWRPGDVARLKDDSPEGMMRYIATHTTGWWQDMAERALRDTEKAERMAQELGLQPGQHWTVVVDAEARERMLAAEEAKRLREKEERAREEAEREAIAKRQLELLEKAGKAPRCEYVFTDGRGCKAPQVRGERWCHGHAKMMSYRPEKLEVLPLEDEESVTVTLYRTVTSLLSGAISEKVAGLVLWSVAIKAPGLMRTDRVIGRSGDRVIGRRQNIHRGGVETRRKGKKHLPQMNAKRRRSKKQAALSNQHSANERASQKWRAAEHYDDGINSGTRETVAEHTPQQAKTGLAGDPEQAPHARRNKLAEDASRDSGSVRGGDLGISEYRDSRLSEWNAGPGKPGTPPQPSNSGPSGDPGTPPHQTKTGFVGDPGVTRHKSFKSGVAGGVPPQSSRSPEIADIAGIGKRPNSITHARRLRGIPAR